MLELPCPDILGAQRTKKLNYNQAKTTGKLNNISPLEKEHHLENPAFL